MKCYGYAERHCWRPDSTQHNCKTQEILRTSVTGYRVQRWYIWSVRRTAGGRISADWLAGTGAFVLRRLPWSFKRTDITAPPPPPPQQQQPHLYTPVTLRHRRPASQQAAYTGRLLRDWTGASASRVLYQHAQLTLLLPLQSACPPALWPAEVTNAPP